MGSGSQANSSGNQDDSGACDTFDEENPCIPEGSDFVVSSLRNKLGKLSSFSRESCICRVPKDICIQSETSYTPQLLSIGPLHHNEPELKSREEQKQMYLNDFLNRTKVSLENIVGIVGKNERALRNCYAEIIGFDSNEFVEMIVVDAVFIIEFYSKIAVNQYQTQGKDPIAITHKPKMRSLSIASDLVMLENQIPFFILEEIYSIDGVEVKDESSGEAFSLTELFFPLFLCESSFVKFVKTPCKIRHLLDLIRTACLPSNYPPREILRPLVIRNLKRLEQAGVRFRPAPSESMLEIKFEDGFLVIPKFFIDSRSEILLRNLAAFEMCHYWEESYLNHYFGTIDCLVDDSKDVEILVRNGILEHWLGDDAEVANLLNNIEWKIDFDSFYNATLFDDLDNFCKTPWHEWKATLKREYFHTPWAIISVVAACLLLILTLIQAVCSILQVV